ncbi:MAG: hypothetical protein IPO08_06235 [Xanthomonadales bacterium]|nr:hypothetical protein [Xanthomonadales bacterium]
MPNETDLQSQPTHVLSPAFKTALLKGSSLNPILKAVQLDDTLLLGIRSGYISIYYRGGELLKIKDTNKSSFDACFNEMYDTNKVLPQRLQRHGLSGETSWNLSTSAQSEELVGVFHELKRLMDHHNKIRSGHEREFQQLIARMNNRSRSSNSSHYFITDIEHAKESARFDMLGVRWRHNEHQRGDCLVPVLFEVKHGEKAIAGGASLEKHLRDALNHVSNPSDRKKLLANIESQFNALYDLDLLECERGKAIASFTVVKDCMQIVFVIAEYPPHSNQLQNALSRLDDVLQEFSPKLEAQGVRVDLRFAGASLCGYAMYEETMLSVEQLRSLLGVSAKSTGPGVPLTS